MWRNNTSESSSWLGLMLWIFASLNHVKDTAVYYMYLGSRSPQQPSEGGEQAGAQAPAAELPRRLRLHGAVATGLRPCVAGRGASEDLRAPARLTSEGPAARL